MKLTLHINRLVLGNVGIDPADADRLREMVESELQRLIAAGEIHSRFTSSNAVDFVRGGVMHLSQDTNPDTLGREIAQAIFGGIRNG